MSLLELKHQKKFENKRRESELAHILAWVSDISPGQGWPQLITKAPPAGGGCLEIACPRCPHLTVVMKRKISPKYTIAGRHKIGSGYEVLLNDIYSMEINHSSLRTCSLLLDITPAWFKLSEILQQTQFKKIYFLGFPLAKYYPAPSLHGLLFRRS